MDIDIYKAPDSDLSTPDVKQAEFYVVSPLKYVMLFVMTFGVYRLYWFYKNWSLYRQKNIVKIMPVMCAIFAIFFTHSLFQKVGKRLKERDPNYCWPGNTLATVYVIGLFIENFSDRLLEESVSAVVLFSVLIVATFALGALLLKAQMAINLACGDPKGQRNSEFSIYNYLWIGFGISGWLLVFSGSYNVLYSDV